MVAICCSPGFTQLSEQVPRTWYVGDSPHLSNIRVRRLRFKVLSHGQACQRGRC